MDQLNEAPETQPEVEAEQPTPAEDVMDAEVTMESLLALEELSLALPKTGQVREGVVVSISDSEALVSIGAKSEGIIPGRELSQLSAEEREAVTLGAELSVFIVTPEDSQGNLILSYSRALEEADWDHAEAIMESKEIYQGKITGYNKGGLIIGFGRLRGFVPASQVSPSRRAIATGSTPDQRWGKMVGQTVIARAIEVDRERRRLILSELAALQEAREIMKERLLNEIETGDVLDGRVTSLANFGAFVNINGGDGLVHLTEVSWERVKHPGDVLKVGQEVKVKVIAIDRERKRIGLSIRQTQDDPWPIKAGAFRDGQLVEGKIVRLTKFGAFARLKNDIEGLIHVSELSERRVEHPKEMLKEGEVVTLRIINIDIPQRRIGLSLRKVNSPAYADLDMQMAMEQFEPEVEEEETPEVEEVEEIVAEEESIEETEAETPVEEAEEAADDDDKEKEEDEE